MTKISCAGILFRYFRLCHSNVPTTTINITPTKAANGMRLMTLEPNIININSEEDATSPDNLVRPPDLTLIID